MSSTWVQYNAETRTVTPQQQQQAAAGGTRQAWKRADTPSSPTLADESRTASAEVRANGAFHEELSNTTEGAALRNFESALAMSDPAPAQTAASSSLSFDDFIDIVNPLQHIPVVNLVYRELTGDTIGPVAQIVGGGIFGGPIGAVSGTVNAVVQESTGKDIAGNVLALVMDEDGVYSVPDSAPASIDRNNPEMALSLAAARYNGDQYVPAIVASAEPPPSAMGFAAMRHATAAYEKASVAEGRTAGWTPKEKDLPALDVDYTPAKISLDALPAREAITALPLNAPSFGGLY